MALEINDSNFKEYLNADKPLLVDFWAPWCGPCKMMGPVVERIAEKYAAQVNVGKLNVDDNGDTCDEYGIRNIPTLLLFKGGELVDRIVGLVPEQELEAHIQKLL